LIHKPTITNSIEQRFIMLSAVDFNYYIHIETNKIYNIPTNQLLTAKFDTQLLVAEFVP